MVNRLLYAWTYLALDIYLRLKDMLLEAELQMIFPLPITLIVIQNGFAIYLVYFVPIPT